MTDVGNSSTISVERPRGTHLEARATAIQQVFPGQVGVRLPAELLAYSHQCLELTVGIASEPDDQVIGAGTGKALEILGRSVSRAAKAGLPLAHHRSRLPVILLEKCVDPLPGATGILVD